MVKARVGDELLRALPAPLLVVNSETLRIVFANAAAEALFDQTHDVLERRTLPELCFPGGRSRVTRALRALQDGQQLHLREALRVGHARQMTAEWSISTASLGGERVLLVVVHAVGGQDESERHTRARGTRGRSGDERGRDLVVRVDPQGCFISANDACCRLFGRTREELAGSNALSFVHPDDIPAAMSARRALRAGNQHVEVELRVLTVHGWRWLRWESLPVQNDAGDMTEVHFFGRDVTGEKLGEAARSEFDEMVRALLNAPMYAAVLVDREGKVLVANATAAHYLNTTSAELTGRSFPLLLPDDGVNERSVRLRRAFETGEPQHFEDERDGHIFEIAMYPLHNNWQQVDRVAIFARDMTDQKHAEDAMRRQDMLLQGVARATQRLMQPGDHERVVSEALQILGQASDTDYAYIFQIIPLPDGSDIQLVQRNLWSRHGDGEAGAGWPDPILVRANGLENLYALLERHEIISGSTETLAALRTPFLERWGIRSLLAAPIFIDARLWGFVGLHDHCEAREWSRQEASALQTMAASIGAAKQREQVETRLRREREIADTLREIGTVLASTLDLDEMLARLLDQARRIVPYDSANVMLIRDNEARIVHCIGHDAFGTPLELVRQVRFSLDGSPYIGQIVRRGTPLLVPDVTRSPVWKHTPGTAHIRCWLGMPILVRGEVVGLFALDSATPEYFNDEHIRMLLPFAQQAAVAFENARLYEQQRAQAAELAARLEQLDALHSASQSILSTLDLDVILSRFAEQMTHLTRSASTTICDFHVETRSGVVQAIWPEDDRACKRGDRVDFGSALLRPVIDEHQLVRLTADEACQAFPGRRFLERIHELVVVPVFSHTRTLGVALLRDYDPMHAFSEDDLQTCRALASQAAIAFEQALLFSDIRELERVKSEMIRLASHDLRGPLTRLQAYLEIFADQFEHLPPERRQMYLRQARETANQMQQIVSDLLSLERIEKQHRMAQPLVWADLVARALETAQAELAEKHHELVVECPADLPIGRGDPVRLERAIYNLIANAIKYTPAGGRITVRGRVKPYGDTPCVAIEIEDTGIGIPLDRQARLFEPFYRVEQDAAADIPGLGLGLSVVKAAVVYHNGNVYVDSEPGKGSLFGFWIPV